MNPEANPIANSEALQILLQQFEALLIFLQRPAVYRQLLAFILVFILAFLISIMLEKLMQGISRTYLTDVNQTHQQLRRWIPKISLLYFPISGLIVMTLTNRWFQQSGFRFGILSDAILLFWVIFAYRIIISTLFTIFSKARIQPYNRYILNPLFILIIAGRLLSNLLDLNLIQQIELTNFLETSITLGNMLGAVLIFYSFLVLSWIIRDGLKSIVLPRIETNSGAANSILTLTRYTILTIGIFVSLGSLGFDLTSLTIIGGGLSVGIGFGLQQIVANFISGIVLLFEQSLRPGDIIDIDGKLGTVQKLSIRSTTVKTFDNIEVIVPNEHFLTSSVTTYTGTDNLIRGSLFVGASYNSNPKVVRDLLLDAASKHGLILKRPEPFVFFVGYGASSLDFRLDFWVGRADRILSVRSDLYFIIWDAFEKHEIEIPFPQRDLNLRGGWQDLLSNTDDNKSV